MGEIELAESALTGVAKAAQAGLRELRPMKHVTRAMTILRDAGIVPSKMSTADNPLVTLMSDLAPLGESEVVAIARTMAHMENFNQMIRERAADIRVGNRFEDIAARFTSIRQDSAAMVKRAERGRRTFTDRVAERVMTMRRGSIADRFQAIAEEAKAVFKDTEEQLRVERGMTDAYRLLRVGVKEAQLMAGELRNVARQQMEQAQAALRTTQAVVDDAGDADVKAVAELDRDQALTVYQTAERRYQTSENIYNGLTVAYATGDVIVSRLAQTTDAKERVLSQGVSFFSTNQSTLTALGITLTGVQGLNEVSRTLGAIKKGTEDALNALADVGTQVQEQALREGYGPTINVTAVKRLMDSVIDYQQRSHQIIQEMRNIASGNAEEVSRVVDEGKAQLVALIHQQAMDTTVGTPAGALPAPSPDTTRGLAVDSGELTSAQQKERLQRLVTNAEAE